MTEPKFAVKTKSEKKKRLIRLFGDQQLRHWISYCTSDAAFMSCASCNLKIDSITESSVAVVSKPAKATQLHPLTKPTERGCIIDIPDIGTAPQAYPHLIFHNLTSSLGKRLSKILQALFPVPAEVRTASGAGTRTVTFANEGDWVSFRHHLGVRTGEKEVSLSEVGPRFEMRLFEIRLGTAENGNADVEWRLTPYQRRGRKEILSEN